MSALLGFFRLVSPLYLRVALGFRSVEIRHAGRLADACRDFYDGKTRLIVAFRHPYGDEAQLMAYVLGSRVAVEARRLGRPLARAPHAIFVHGYEVPLWAGAFERWILPRVGAVPVYHVHLDQEGIRRIRRVMTAGRYPLALAPEGQVSYTSEGLPRIEQGTARIALWCAGDLAREGRRERVVILPVSVHHRWDRGAERNLDRLIARTERECGFAAPAGASRLDRLDALAGHLLGLMERAYGLGGARGAGPAWGGTDPRGAGHEGSRPGSRAERRTRLLAVLEAALVTAERALSLGSGGDTIQRVYRIRQAGWDRIFRADIPDPDALPPVERALADRLAGEAWFALRHMELVDLAWYLDLDRLGADAPREKVVETAQNLFDLVSRLEGGNISDRLGVRGKRAVLVAGEPITVGYPPEHGGLKSAVAELTGRLENSFRTAIREIQKERSNG